MCPTFLLDDDKIHVYIKIAFCVNLKRQNYTTVELATEIFQLSRNISEKGALKCINFKIGEIRSLEYKYSYF